ncbi:MAG: hypothetical protein ACRD68_12505, partial [Pyrinomonadaceae bacterium]
MLKIRKVQMQTFEQAAVRSFEDRMIEHLREFTPRHFKILKEAEMRKVVRFGMERAPAYGLTSERSIRYFVELMLMLGSHFNA